MCLMIPPGMAASGCRSFAERRCEGKEGVRMVSTRLTVTRLVLPISPDRDTAASLFHYSHNAGVLQRLPDILPRLVVARRGGPAWFAVTAIARDGLPAASFEVPRRWVYWC